MELTARLLARRMAIAAACHDQCAAYLSDPSAQGPLRDVVQNSATLDRHATQAARTLASMLSEFCSPGLRPVDFKGRAHRRHGVRSRVTWSAIVLRGARKTMSAPGSFKEVNVS